MCIVVIQAHASLRQTGICSCSMAFFTQGKNFPYGFVFLAFLDKEFISLKGSICRGKNLLIREQIQSF